MRQTVRAGRNLGALTARARRDPLAYWLPTAPQLSWLKDPARVRLFRAGNQIGKSAAQSYEIVTRLLGRSPYRAVPPAPTTVWLVCHSWSQSQVLQCKIYDMMPPGALHKDCIFTPGKGFSGITPIIRMQNGSICRIRTTSQAKGRAGMLGLESDSVSYIGIDEPCPRDVWGSLSARTLRGGTGGAMGEIGITMTPLGDVEYLREMVEKGRISETVAALTVENCTPINPRTGQRLRPLVDQKTIDEISGSYLPMDRAARISGAWEIGEIEGRVFDSFDSSMITQDPCPQGGEYRFAIGIDHGTQPNTQIAIQCAIDVSDLSTGYPRVWILDEYVSGMAPAEAHAAAISAMIRRAGLTPEKIHYWHGDTVHSGTGNKSGKMSNSLLNRAFERVLHYPPGRLPFKIITVKKPRGSVYHGCALLHSIMARRDFFVAPTAKSVIKSLMTWQIRHVYSKRGDDPLSHAVDALRYCVVPVIDRAWSSAPSSFQLLRSRR